MSGLGLGPAPNKGIPSVQGRRLKLCRISNCAPSRRLDVRATKRSWPLASFCCLSCKHGPNHPPTPPPNPAGTRWQLFLALDTWVFCSRRMSGLESLSGNPTRGCCKQPHAAVAKLGALPPSTSPPPILLFEMNQTGSRRNHGSGSESS